MGDMKRQVFNIYVDETSKNDVYFGVGAILCEDKAADEITGVLDGLAIDHEADNKEFHWKEFKNSNRLISLYSKAGTTLIGFSQGPRKMRYRALLVERAPVYINRQGGETFEDVIAKFIFTLVFQIAKQIGGSIDYHVFIDSPDGDTRSDIATLSALNNRYRSTYHSEGPFKSVQYVRSENSRMIQATDLLTAVIAYEMNGRHLVEGAAIHKKTVFAALLEKSRLRTFTMPTGYWPPQFQIQHFDFNKSDFTRHKPVTNPQHKPLD